MSISLRSFTFSRLSCIASVLWLCGTGAAWAGAGGEDSATLQSLLNFICSEFGIPCPQFPTYATATLTPISPPTPIVLEIAAWENVSPDSIRIQDSDCEPFGMGGGPLPYCPQVAINATNAPAKTPVSDPAAAPSFLDALAFVANPAATAPLTVTQNFDPNATSYIYAVTEGPNGQPNTLDIFFRSANGTNTTHSKGQVVAAISLPLAVLVNGAAVEKSIVANVQVSATCNGVAACFTANVLADFAGTGTKQTYSLADLGLNFAFYSGPPATYEVQIPLLVNTKTDQFYFLNTSFLGISLPGCPNGGNVFSGYCNAFSATNPPNGFAPQFLSNTVVGMAPSAAPQCTGNPPAPGTPGQAGAPCPTTLPSNPPQPLSPTFGFCAFLSNNAFLSNSPDAAFFLAIGTDGTTYLSSTVNPALSGAPYPACPS
jgi:hypothetical protein